MSIQNIGVKRERSFVRPICKLGSNVDTEAAKLSPIGRKGGVSHQLCFCFISQPTKCGRTNCKGSFRSESWRRREEIGVGHYSPLPNDMGEYCTKGSCLVRKQRFLWMDDEDFAEGSLLSVECCHLSIDVGSLVSGPSMVSSPSQTTGA